VHVVLKWRPVCCWFRST